MLSVQYHFFRITKKLIQIYFKKHNMYIVFMLSLLIKDLMKLYNTIGFPFSELYLPSPVLKFFRSFKLSTFMNVHRLYLRKIVHSQQCTCNLISVVQIQSKFGGTVNGTLSFYVYVYLTSQLDLVPSKTLKRSMSKIRRSSDECNKVRTL